MPDRMVDEEELAKEEDQSAAGAAQGSRRQFKDFDCPDCNANNPLGEPFGDADELLCSYCGAEFKAIVSDEGKLKLKSM
ncbi:MAG: hypothetical protein ACYCWW_00605 [Deltaproteobacteria bacterium]